MTTSLVVPAPPTLDDMTSAARRLAGVITRTPIEPAPWLSEIAGVPVFLKLECYQRTRSFKLRGAYNAIASLTTEEKSRGLVTASAGNHGQAVAVAASLVGTPVTVFVPRTAPKVKRDRIRAFGATLDESCATYDDAEAAAIEFARDTQRYFVHPYSDSAVVAGQGTVGIEIIEELPQVRNIITPVGGGGLSSGIGIVLRELAPTVKMIGVQSSETHAMHDAFAAGRIVDSPITPTIADGLAGCTDEKGYAWLRGLIDTVHLVADESLSPAIRQLYEKMGVVAEGAGIVGVAAVLNGAISLDGPAVIVISGGNIDTALLASILTA